MKQNIKVLAILGIVLSIIILFQGSPLLKKKLSRSHGVAKLHLFQKNTLQLDHKNKFVTPETHAINFQELSYPGANEIERSNNTIVFVCPDDPQLISDWYKNIIQKKFSVKTFVQNKINGDVHNKLIGEDRFFGISVEVNKNLDQSLSTITVTISNS